MKTVTIYTRPWCVYCIKAKFLLKRKGIDFQEISVGNNHALREEMYAKSGGRTFPQILIGGEAIGGSDMLFAMARTGRLDALLFSDEH